MFNFKKKITKKKDDVFTKISESKYCNPMNDLTKEHIIDGKKCVLLNPHNQLCFNSGWFTEEDYSEWLVGKGPIVKGKTDEEKEITWKVAKFEKDHKHAWMIVSYCKFLNELVSERIPTKFGEFYNDLPKINKKNKKQILIRILNHWVWDTLDDLRMLEYSVNPDLESKIYHDFSKSWRYISKTLVVMGLGYHSYVNTPEDIFNLSWVRELVFAKAYYEHLKLYGNEDDIPTLDEIIFVDENRWK